MPLPECPQYGSGCEFRYHPPGHPHLAQQQAPTVTTPVTRVTTPRTQSPPVTTPVTREQESGMCVCPDCGAPHTRRTYASAAERKRASRARKRGDG